MTRDIRVVEGKIFTVDFSLLLNIALCLPSVIYPACTSQATLWTIIPLWYLWYGYWRQIK